MPTFIVEYETIPAPGQEFYQGHIRIYARDIEDASARAPREIARREMFSQNSIRVTNVSKSNG